MRIGRINELARMQKERALSAEEKAEQAALRREYIDAFKENVHAALKQVRMQREDGSLCELKPKDCKEDA
ncbi:MAG: DUF896 domain-containing protein [Bacillota bacterium]